MAGEGEGVPIVGVCLMVAIAVVGVGGPAAVVVLIWSAGRRQRREALERWERGLVAQGFAPGPVEAYLRVQRAGVTFDATLFERGAPQNRHWVTQVCARHAAPLGLGLQVDQVRPEASMRHEWYEWARSAAAG